MRVRCVELERIWVGLGVSSPVIACGALLVRSRRGLGGVPVVAVVLVRSRRRRVGVPVAAVVRVRSRRGRVEVPVAAVALVRTVGVSVLLRPRLVFLAALGFTALLLEPPTIQLASRVVSGSTARRLALVQPRALGAPLDQRTQGREQLLPIAPGCVVPAVFKMHPINAHFVLQVSVYKSFLYST